MTETTSLPLFLGSVIAISLTGAMMPGPVTAIAISRGSKHKVAGALVALGHALVEFPLILLIYFGVARFLDHTGVRIAVGLVGGWMLVWMALGLFRAKASTDVGQRILPGGSIMAGLATTAANPYFFVWWATVGTALIATARDFGGGPGVAAMGVAHWLCDFGWLLLLSWVVFKSKRVWTQKVDRIVLGVSAAILAGFGVWFIVTAIQLALTKL